MNLIKNKGVFMAYLPEDINMLLSFINMKLRDEYPSLSALCEDMEADEQKIKQKLSSAGYVYDENKNAFI